MSEVDSVAVNNASGDENTQNEKPGRGKKTKSPRVSTIDRTREESEAITKDLGPEVEGRRRTRSAAKGVVPATPPVEPAKKKRKGSTSGSGSGGAKARGRPKRNANTEESDSHDESKDASTGETEETPKKEEVDSKTNDSVAVENNAHETKDEAANNNAETPKQESDTTENGAKEDSIDGPSEEKSEEKKEQTADEEDSTATEAEKSAE